MSAARSSATKSSAPWVVCGHRGVFPIVGRERARPPRLSKRHGRPHRRHPPRPRGGIPADRDRWVRVRRWGECAPLLVGVRLWSRAQDSAERSRRPSRTAPADRPGGSAEGCAVGVGGFRDPAHLVRRASHPHDSPRLGVRAPSLALPRPWRRPQLHGHVDLLRGSYNVIRPHRALQCGRETRTPAMHAGLVNAPMNWSDIVTAPATLYAFHVAVVRVPGAVPLMHTRPAALASFSWPHEHRSAA